MKAKLFITIVWFVFGCQFVAAQEGQIKNKIRSEYMQFLREEGFLPTIDVDGDIKFKKEGVVYYIDVYDEESPQYIVVSAPGFQLGGEDGYDRAKGIKAALEVNKRIRGVKLVVFDESIAVRVSFPFANSESFKGVFYTIISYLDSGRERFLEEYNK